MALRGRDSPHNLTGPFIYSATWSEGPLGTERLQTAPQEPKSLGESCAPLKFSSYVRDPIVSSS